MGKSKLILTSKEELGLMMHIQTLKEFVENADRMTRRDIITMSIKVLEIDEEMRKFFKEYFDIRFEQLKQKENEEGKK